MFAYELFSIADRLLPLLAAAVWIAAYAALITTIKEQEENR